MDRRQKRKNKERASETISTRREKEKEKENRHAIQPPPSSATPLLPCAEPDKVALIKICHFPLPKKHRLCHQPPSVKYLSPKQKFPYLMGKLYITEKPVWAEGEKQRVGWIVSAVISSCTLGCARSLGVHFSLPLTPLLSFQKCDEAGLWLVFILCNYNHLCNNSLFYQCYIVSIVSFFIAYSILI